MKYRSKCTKTVHSCIEQLSQDFSRVMVSKSTYSKNIDTLITLKVTFGLCLHSNVSIVTTPTRKPTETNKQTNTHLGFNWLNVFVWNFPRTYSFEFLDIPWSLFFIQPEGGNAVLISLQTTIIERKLKMCKSWGFCVCSFLCASLMLFIQVSYFLASGVFSKSVITIISSISRRNLFNSNFML